ncbi:hypothetical protein D6T64_04360 [Cryobacterium melibiosiphilum]|uniref:Uncharacterized protein n=1 Tax=Cryobacterium melibiosiphilum TaxID=995039 RepID=A0A3A5MML0_9MICO|nr:hypothetical protein [Cryobacterium melibiosiphilum]RJT90261.1 hypothetical protein D6T64_04360 [Cryobacterium melibiosiphilum]
MVILTVTGCSPNLDVDSYSSVRAVLSEQSEAIGLPLDDYLMTSSDESAAQAANFILMNACMEESGLEYELGKIDWSDVGGLPDRRYGLWSADNAARYGYNIPTDAAVADAYATVDEKSEDETYYNSSMNCVQSIDAVPIIRADYEGDANVTNLTEVATRGVSEAQQYAREQSEWDAAIDEWHQCATDAGLTVDASGDEEVWTPRLPATDEESRVKIAVVDVACKSQVQLIQRLSDLEARYQAAYIAENEARLKTLADAKAAALERIRSIVAQGGS